MKYIAVMLCIVVISACETRQSVVLAPRYMFQVDDDISRQRFDIRVISQAARQLCVRVDLWPNGSGELIEGGLRSSLELDTKVVKGRNGFFGESFGGDVLFFVVEPYGTLHGFISYVSFGDPELIANSHKRHLVFNVVPDLCTRYMLRHRAKSGGSDE